MPKRSRVAAVDGISDEVLLRLIEKCAREWTSRTNPDAMSIEQFCALHNISRATIYEMMAEGTGPDVMAVKGRVLISREAAQRWRASREQAARADNRGSRKAAHDAEAGAS
jgi:predicted DNA-binding transcriptional regulator AlpA